jgi:hypothetical protein
VDEIQIGNKFTVELINFPVKSDFREALTCLHSMFERMKKSSHYFAMYMVSIIMGGIVPYQISYNVLHKVTKFMSFAWTNLPGPKKPIVYNGKKSKRAWVFYIPVGQCGVSMALYSHNGIVKLGVTADDAMMKDP